MPSSTLVGKEKETGQVSETSLSFQKHEHWVLEFYSSESMNELSSWDKINTRYRKNPAGTSLDVQWLRLRASSAGGVGLIPGPGN